MTLIQVPPNVIDKIIRLDDIRGEAFNVLATAITRGILHLKNSLSLCSNPPSETLGQGKNSLSLCPDLSQKAVGKHKTYQRELFCWNKTKHLNPSFLGGVYVQ